MAYDYDSTINIFNWADKLSESNPAFSSRKSKCRKEFLSFLEANEYFGAQRLDNEVIICDDAERIRPNVELWLCSYGVGNAEKLKLLSKRLAELFPVTGNIFSCFLDECQAESSIAWKLADYLCFALHSEITAMSDEYLHSLAEGMDRDLPLNSARLFSELLMYAREQHQLPNGWTYCFNSRCETKTSEAYAAPDFLKMAYIVFNDDARKKRCLLEKALQSERDANLWLFVSLHFICGWRGTDVVRLPMPTLPFSGEKIREQLMKGSFDTENIINELEFRLQYSPLKPQKTEIHENIPELKLFVPESLRRPMGIILAAAASHHEVVEPGGRFLKKAGDRAQIVSFFGADFAAACGRRGFSSRRANKSYLQGIEAAADVTASRPKGYMLAALARSHKGGFGTLPEATDVYLRDANFSGYRPEFIAREMFERGVFSFIPTLMMEMYAPDTYTKLPLTVQTKALAVIGINASGLEGLTKIVETAQHRARSAIAEIMRKPEAIRGSVADILQNIASGNAPGRQDGCLCLMTASGFACTDAGRSCCIGCGYEIYTKTILQCLSKEYARLLSKRSGADTAEAVRCTKILKEAVMPAISEMLMSIKQLYPDADISTLLDATEMGAALC